MTKICIAIPVLNEEENINKIFFKIKKLNKKLDILFIEDNSQDNTKKKILELKKKNKNVFFIFRKKNFGIGSAHKDAIKWCYLKDYRYVITMDCDGTHDPKYIPKLLNAAKKYDLVITTRFKNADSIDDWPSSRKFLTRIRFIITRIILKITLDASGAYRCFDTKKIFLTDVINIKSNSYNYFIESIYNLNEKEYSIYEVPIKMPFRKLGKSKMSLKHIFLTLASLIRIRFFN